MFRFPRQDVRNNFEFFYSIIFSNSFEYLDYPIVWFSTKSPIEQWINVDLLRLCSVEPCIYIENFQVKGQLASLMNLLDEEGFFSIDDDSIDWVLFLLITIIL